LQASNINFTFWWIVHTHRVYHLHLP
jgi:hypothetical protein